MMALRLEDLPENTQAELLGPIARPRKASKKGEAAELFHFHLRSRQFTGWIREHRFAQVATGREWRFDFCNPQLNLAVEVEGLVVKRYGTQLFVSGRHASITGFKEDAVKYATAAVLGWQVMRFEQSQVRSGEAIDFVEQWYAARGLDRKTGRPVQT